MVTLKGTYNLMREAYGPFFPTPTKKREEFMNRVRERVDYYKPLIEEKFGINLGNVKVKDNKEWLPDLLYETAPILAAKHAWADGKVPTEIDFNLSFIGASIAEVIALPPTWLYSTIIMNVDFRHNDGTIYVPFNYANRFLDIDFKGRSKRMDYGVVHELSHTLWGRLSENKDRDFKVGRKWSEGFATYCTDVYFENIFPSRTQKIYELPKVYTKGKEIIERVIAEHGENILLEIPKRWEEFQKELN